MDASTCISFKHLTKKAARQLVTLPPPHPRMLLQIEANTAHRDCGVKCQEYIGGVDIPGELERMTESLRSRLLAKTGRNSINAS